jgi:hypothetical protein
MFAQGNLLSEIKPDDATGLPPPCRPSMPLGEELERLRVELAAAKNRLVAADALLPLAAGEEVIAGLPAPLACLPPPSTAAHLRSCGLCNGGASPVASRPSCRPSPAADALVPPSPVEGNSPPTSSPAAYPNEKCETVRERGERERRREGDDVAS